MSFLKFAGDEEGATAVEYALLAAIIAVGIVSSLKMVGGTLQSNFNSVATGIQSVGK